MEVRRIIMGGGVPGTSAFPYFSGSETAPMNAQSDWALFSILSDWAPRGGQPYSAETKVSAAKEWRRRYPTALNYAHKRWAFQAEQLACELLRKIEKENS